MRNDNPTMALTFKSGHPAWKVCISQLRQIQPLADIVFEDCPYFSLTFATVTHRRDFCVHCVWSSLSDKMVICVVSRRICMEASPTTFGAILFLGSALRMFEMVEKLPSRTGQANKSCPGLHRPGPGGGGVAAGGG